MPEKYPEYASHQPILAAMAAATTGPVLELGCGFGSTYLLHELCRMGRRHLLTVEHDAAWRKLFSHLEDAAPWHHFLPVKKHELGTINWAAREEWGLVLVDHGEAKQRGPTAMRFADVSYPVVVLVHDCGLEQGVDHYAVRECLSAFPHVAEYKALWPRTLCLSNRELPYDPR